MKTLVHKMYEDELNRLTDFSQLIHGGENF